MFDNINVIPLSLITLSKCLPVFCKGICYKKNEFVLRCNKRQKGCLWTQRTCYGLENGNPIISFWFRLYKPVQTVSPEETPTNDFLKLDAVNISNILNHKKATSTIPAYLKKQSPPIISYRYSSPIAPKIFNNKTSAARAKY